MKRKKARWKVEGSIVRCTLLRSTLKRKDKQPTWKIDLLQ